MSANEPCIECGRPIASHCQSCRECYPFGGTERSPGTAPLDALVDAITEATPMIRDWLADEGPNTRDVARFIADRLGTDR